MKLLLLPPGKFRMGTPVKDKDYLSSEDPHQVTLTKAFYLGVYEVTQEQWQAVMGNNPSELKGAGPSAPVDNVSWTDCQQFIAHLGGVVETSVSDGHSSWRYTGRPFSS